MEMSNRLLDLHGVELPERRPETPPPPTDLEYFYDTIGDETTA
jgi:hypothetical protein